MRGGFFKVTQRLQTYPATSAPSLLPSGAIPYQVVPGVVWIAALLSLYFADSKFYVILSFQDSETENILSRLNLG